jgi:hypothetical protein
MYTVTIQFKQRFGPTAKATISSETLSGLADALRVKKEEMSLVYEDLGSKAMIGKWIVKKDGKIVGTLNLNGTIAEVN